MAPESSPVRLRLTTTRSQRRLVPTLSIAGAVLIALTGTANADPAPSATTSGAMHQDADHAGSTIRAHEGGQTATITPQAISGPKGMDVSSWQGNVNWNAAWNNGARFAYVKATEGTGYTNPYFTQQYNGSYNVGMIRGAYHFARPNISSGATQADFFVNHGGGWSADGKTLPPMLDIEYNPYGSTCYGLSQSAMVNWIWSFFNRMVTRTGRYVTIYTTTNWWTTCTGNYGGFGAYSPLFIARYASTAGTLPNGWSFYTIWQYADSGIFPGDQDVFNGAYDRLVALAKG
jgi:GH25 family lysozyme M1 (1,4-beta-N-acetylmuramidase)